MVTYSMQEVTRLAGVTSRTLRHYDQIGLLQPVATDRSGTRHYDRERLLRLQHILLLRELGLGLLDIATVLDGATDEVAALRRHHERLLGEVERLRTLADTVARTIDEREGGPAMATEEIFTGFADDPYAEEARERWGDTARESQERVAGWSPGRQQEVQGEMRQVHAAFIELKRAGVPADSPDVAGAVAAHHAWVSRFWTPGRDAYVGLGRMYVDDERFTATIDADEPGLAVYLRDAIAAWAPEHLS
jgi:MerR family transcriptional regulator, thiopeptide resistance regulator